MTLETETPPNSYSLAAVIKTSSLKGIESNLHSKEEREHLESELHLAVNDSGLGFPLDALEKIFSVHALASHLRILGKIITRSQLISLNNLIQNQGGILSIENGIDSG